MKIKTCRDCGINYSTSNRCPKCGSMLYTSWEALGEKGQYWIPKRFIWASMIYNLKKEEK